MISDVLPPDWVDAIPHIGGVSMSSFADLDVWTARTAFAPWPAIEPSAHEFNCRKGKSLVRGVGGVMSAAEIEIVRSLRDAGWNAGWLATCGRRNDMWRKYMLAASSPATSTLPVPLPLVPSRIAAVLVRNGSAGFPDVVAWKSERHPIFVELKGPGDKGTNQATWLDSALARADIGRDDFLLLNWTSEPIVAA